MSRRVKKSKKKEADRKVAKRVDGQIRNKVINGARGKSSRQRTQVILYQAPTPTVIRRKVTKTSNVKNTIKSLQKGVKSLKYSKGSAKVIVKKVLKTTEKSKKVKIPAKKGNDRLTPRVITEYVENPFFANVETPEYVSASVYHRWIIRAIRNGNMKEIKDYYQSKKCQKSSIYSTFAYNYDTTASYEACLKDVKFATDFFKMNYKMDNDDSYRPGKEPNLLQYKSTGRKNNYMIGRHTRHIEMGRGGKEGNNALLNYSARPDFPKPVIRLIEDNIPYTKLFQLCKIKNGPFWEDQLETHFVTAVRMGHRELASALAQGPARNHCNDLHRLTLKDEKLPEKILPASVVKKAFMNKNLTPLHSAAISNSTHMLEAMRNVCPQINIPDQDNWYTIHYAACAPGIAPLEYLVKNGGSVTMLNKRTETPLHVAARTGRPANCAFIMKEMLDLEKGDDGESTIRPDRSLINARSRFGNSALHLAVIHNRLDVVDTLLVEPTVLVDLPTSTGQNRVTPLMLACANGHLEMAKKLVAKGALIEAKDKKKRTPLIHAILNGQMHVVAFLLAKGASLSLADSSGNTPAHYASAYGFLDCLKLLASVDDNVLAEGNDWQLYPLSIAYLKGHYGIVSWLLEGPHKDKANINAKDNNGATLLLNLMSCVDEASHKDLLHQIEYLVARGADASIPDSSGATPLHLFAEQRAIFKGSGEAPEIDATRMTLQNYEKCFKVLLAAGASVEAYDNENKTPFHVALSNGNLMLFTWMLEKVADKRKLLNKWADHQNFLHEILLLPMKVYGDQVLWKGDKLTKPAYDVLPILQDLHEYLPDLFERWIGETSKAGYSPIVEAVKHYRALVPNKELSGEDEQSAHRTRNQKQFGRLMNFKKAPHVDSLELKTFISSVNALFEWIIRLGPFQLTQKYFNADNTESVTLAKLAMSIPIEEGKHQQNHLALFKILIKLSKEFNNSEEFLTQKCEKYDVLILEAIMLDMPRVAELILNTATELKLFNGIHNVVREKELDLVVNKTIIMYLIEKNMWDLIQKVNASLDFWKKKDAKGNSVWHYAARINNHKTVSLFKQIEAKGVPREANLDGRTVLHVATLACDGSANSVLEPIAWLSTKCLIETVDKYNRTALHYAFGNENDFKDGNVPFGESDPIAVVSLLSSLILPNQIEIADINGNTILHLAAIKNSTICLMSLTRKKCRVDIKNKDGNTPLALAVHYGKQSAALTLIQANADVTEKIFIRSIMPSTFSGKNKHSDEEEVWKWLGKTEKVEKHLNTTIPATIVSKGGSWEAIVYVLLDVLGQNTTSMAQLTDAALRNGQLNLANQLLKSIEALLDGGVLNGSYDLLNTFAEKCFGELTSEETIEITVLNKIIHTRGIALNQPESMKIIRTALQHGNWNLLNFLKTEMGAVAWKNQKIESPTENPIRSLVIYMNKKSVNTNAIGFLNDLKGMRGISVDALCQFEVPEKFKNLLNFGLLPPISFAVLQENPDLIRALRSAGADLKIKDDYGRTPLMFAIMTNNRAVVDAVVGDGKKVAVLPKQVNTPSFNGPRVRAVPMLFKTARASLAAVSTPDIQNGAGSSLETEDEDNDSDDRDSGSENGSGDDEEGSPPPTKKARVEQEESSLSTPNRCVLTITDPTLFAARDQNGYNALHYLIEPLAWENIDLLADLAASNKKAIVDCLVDKFCPNPIELAAKNMNRKMKNKMLDIVHGTALPRSIKSTQPTIQPVNIVPLSNADEDAAKFINKWSEENDKRLANEVPKPHANSTYATSGTVCYCTETQQYFNILMNKTDLNYGRYGFHNFYRMQIIKRRDAELYILFTNWGRIGEGCGEFQTTPFSSLDLAAKEFKSIFKSKSGNEWLPLANFQVMPKKYRLVEIDSSPSNLSEVELIWKKNTEKEPIRKMIADISDVKTLKQYAAQVKMNGTGHPFGRFTKESIEKAKLVLEKLEKNAKRIKQIADGQNVSESNLLNAYITTSELSSDYYNLIPTGDFEYSNLTRLDTIQEIARHRSLLNRYHEVETATRILCGAEFRQDLDRIDYIRTAIQCEFRLETPDSDISQQILEWIYNSGGKNTKVKMIVEIAPKESTEKFEPFINDDNQMFLWHGTKATNLISILKNGFLVDPPSVCPNGSLFGSGIYLADSFEKSSHYCQPSAAGVKYMLVCQTALGKVRELHKIPYSYSGQQTGNAEKGEDTLHYIGNEYPSGSLTSNGIAVPLLPLKKRDDIDGQQYGYNTLSYSEYIVRNPHRVLPKYIVIYQ